MNKNKVESETIIVPRSMDSDTSQFQEVQMEKLVSRGDENKEEYKVYKRRYAIMATVVILNISNAALWCSYAPVATKVSGFYKVSLLGVNWFSLSYLIISFPFCFVATYIVDRFGLNYGIHIGAALNVFGAIVKAIGTSAIFSDLGTMYAVSLTGQVFCAMAQSFILFMSTKVSQNWFPERQRTVITTVLAMSNPLGIVIAQVVTPFIIWKQELVPINNYIWMALAIVGEIFTVIFFTRAMPKTPPSKSALEQETREHVPYLHQLRNALKTRAYLYLFVVLGATIGIFNAVSTLTQQILCSIGYSDVIAGSATGVMILMGFVGSAITGIVADKTKEFTLITKIAFGGAALSLVIMMQFYLVPDLLAALLIFCGLFGLFGVGVYPIGLELAVELTYPVEESISTAFIFLSGQVHGIVIIMLVPLIAWDRDAEDLLMNSCSSDTLDVTPKNYKVPLQIVAAYMILVVLIMIIFMKSRHKRHEAEIKSETISSKREEVN